MADLITNPDSSLIIHLNGAQSIPTAISEVLIMNGAQRSSALEKWLLTSEREDHRTQHYREVHMKEKEYHRIGQTGRIGGSGGRNGGTVSSFASSGAPLAVASENQIAPMQNMESTRNPTAEEESVPPSGDYALEERQWKL